MNQLSFFQPPSWTVTDLTRYLRELFESDEILQDVWVQGEISNLSRPASGHLYFTIKDSSAALKCVMWRNAAIRQVFTPRDGDAIEVHGSLSVYEASGQYQLYADLIRPAGEGLLYQEFLRLKARLQAEGLFDEARKRPIPRWPGLIGIVTSPSGAALRDMLNTLQRRYPLARAVLAPPPAQEEEPPAGIIAALQRLNTTVAPDVILLARGGGSIEDLWAFNDERVARAIVASAAPVITGVGHETDFTIADFVADLRAATPTAAAELATPDRADLRYALDEMGNRMAYSLTPCLDTYAQQLAVVENRLAARSPLDRVRSGRQRLDELSWRTSIALAHRLELSSARLAGLEQRLQALNPMGILQRGYALVTKEDGQLIRRVEQVYRGEALNVRVSNGRFGVYVKGGDGIDA